MANARAVIDIDINTSGAAAGLKQLQAQINAFNSTLTKSSAVQATAMRNSKDNLLELVNATRFFSAETVKMQTAAATLDRTLSKGQVTLGQFFSAKFRKDGVAAAQVMSLANARASALQTQFIATGAAANGMREAIAIRPLQAFNDAAVVSAQKLAIQRAMLNQATTSMINFGKNTQWAGRQLMVGFTVPLSIFGGLAGKTFMELEKEAVNFKKVYGDAFTPPEEMEANLKAIQELGKEYTKYGIAVKDTVGLAAQAAAAGAQNQDLIDATTQSTRLATLGQMEQNQALETTISLQNAFRLSGDELAKSINFLNMVENQTVVTLQDLSAAIPRVAPVIQGLGGSVEDLAAFLAAMQEGGVSAEQGANALKSGLASLINPTDRAKEKLQALGISLDAIIQANRGDLMGTVQAFSRALATLDEFSRQQALEQVFGKFQYARLGALFDNITRAGSQASRVIETAGLSAEDMAAAAEKELGAIEESAGVKLVAAMERLKLAIAPIGELFVKMATPIINFVAKIAEAFNNLPDGAKQFLGIATVITGLVIPAGTMFLGLLMNLVGTLIKFGNIVGLAFKGFVSGGFKGAFDNVSQALRFMSLQEIDAANSAQQLAGTTQAVNTALLNQVTASDSAKVAIGELAFAYNALSREMAEAAALSPLVFGPGVGAARAAGPRTRRRGYNKGGNVVPGTGNRDTVPAILTPGEFVVNKKATQQNMPLLEAINSGSLRGFSKGGTEGNPFIKVDVDESQVSPLLLEKAQDIRSRNRLAVNENLQTRISDQDQLKTQRTHFSASSKITSIRDLESIPGFSEKSKRWSFGRELIKRGLFVESLSDDWLRFPSDINQAARENPIKKMTVAEAIKMLEANPDKVASSVGRKKSLFAQIYPEKSGRDISLGIANELKKFPQNAQITDAMLSDARNRAFPLMGSTRANITGMRIPSALALGSYFGLDPNSRTFYKDLNKALASSGIRIDEVIPQKAGSKPYRAISMLDRAGKVMSFMGRGRVKSLFAQKPAASTPFAKGGRARGKNGVPAMLTPGEFIVNKDAAQSNMALLEAINSGKIKGFAKGGEVIGYEYGTARPITDPEEAKYMARTGSGIYANERDARSARNPMSSKAVGQRISRAIAVRRQTRASTPSLGQRYSGAVRGGVGKLAGAGGMRGMGIGMGMSMAGGAMMMGSSMMPAGAAATAMNVGGTALSMAGFLPMLGPMLAPLAGIAPVALPLIAVLGAATAALVIWRRTVDDTARKAAEFGANIGGTANSLEKMAAILGKQTPAEQRAQAALRMTEEDKSFVSNEFAQILASDEGNSFINELKNATSEERFRKLTDYLRNAVASGMLDQSAAQSFAKAVGMQLGDVALGTAAATAIKDQKTGPDALLNIARQRVTAVEDSPAVQGVINAAADTEISYQQASIAIGAATQITQDYANVIAIAEQQWKDGEISYQRYINILNEARGVQEEYNGVLRTALTQSSDRGAVTQALESQLVAGGDVTQEQINAMRDAMSVGISTLGGGASVGVTEFAAPTAFEAEYMKSRAAEQGIDLQTMFDTNREAFNALAEEAAKAKTATMQLTEQGLQEFLLQAVNNNEITMDEATKLGNYLANNPLGEGAQAFLDGANVQEITSLINSANAEITGFTESQTEQYRSLATELNKAGLSLVDFESHILSLPEAVRQAEMDRIEGIGAGRSAEEQGRIQAEYVVGSQRLQGMFGQEIGTDIAQTQAYQQALETEGSGRRIEDALAKAQEGGVSENVIKYIVETEGASNPDDFVLKTNQMTNAVENIASLPDEMIKGLEIDINAPEDLERFGPMVDQLKKNWGIIENLNKNIDLTASMEYLTMENGKPLTAEQTSKKVQTLNKAWKNLSSTNPKIRRQAEMDIAVSYAGKTVGGSPEEAAENAVQGLRDQFKNFDKFDPVVREQMLQVRMGYEVKNLQLAMQLESAMQALETATDPESRRRIMSRIAQLQSQMGTAKVETEAQLGAMASGAETTGSKGGGGGGEKSIIAQLKEEAKNLGDFSKAFASPRAQGLMAGPFGPKFLEYLQSQGKKGLEILRGNITKFKEAFAEFKKARRAEQEIAFSMLPAQNIQLQKEINQRRQLTGLVTQYAKNQGISIDMSRAAFDALSDENRAELIRLEKKDKLNKKERERLELLRQQLALNVEAQQIDLAQQQQDYVRGVQDEFAITQRLEGLGYRREEIEALKSIPGLQQMSNEKIAEYAALLRGAVDQRERDNLAIQDNINVLNIMSNVLGQAADNFDRINIKPLRDSIDSINDSIEALDRSKEGHEDLIESYEKQKDAQSEIIDNYEKEKDKIEEVFDDRIKSLEKIENINERIARQQRGQLDIASALSRGDIAGAAQATLAYQQEQASMRIQDARDAIEAQRESELSIFDEKIKSANEEILRIDELIKAERDKISGIDDQIEAKRRSIRDINDQIKTQEEEKEKIMERQRKIQAAINYLQIEQQINTLDKAAPGYQQSVTLLQQQQSLLAQSVGGPAALAEFGISATPTPGLDIAQMAADLQLAISPAQQLSALLGSLALNPQVAQAFKMITDNMVNGVLPNIDTVMAKAAELEIDPAVADEAYRIATEFITVSNTADESNKNMVAMLTDAQQVNGVIGGINAIINALNLQAQAAANANRVRRQELEAAANVANAAGYSGAPAVATTQGGKTPPKKSEPTKKGGKKNKGQKRAFGGMINYKGSTEAAPGMMYGGKMKKYAYGSIVPGIGMTDRVPALLTPGEFVVRKSVAAEYGPLLAALNSNVFPKMNMSGPMPKASSNTRDGIQYNYDIDVNVAGTNASPDEIAQAVMYRIKRIDDRQVRGTKLG